MPTLNNALAQLAADPNNARVCYTLAGLYLARKHYAAAISFFLRCAEHTDEPAVAYSCLLNIAQCFAQQGGRPLSERAFYKHAICLLPARPEAYFFLSKYYEYFKEYADSYMMAELGLQCAATSSSLIDSCGYPGRYGLLFQKARAAWWWGKAQECRGLHKELLDNYSNQLDDTHRALLADDILNIGAGSGHMKQFIYDASQNREWRYKFPGLSAIQRSYSQVLQDMFVLSLLQGKREGRYLELGSAGPFSGNNTALLESDFGWSGVGVDFDAKAVEDYKAKRRNTVICADARSLDYSALLNELAPDGVVDYLQLDCDPPQVTFELLLSIPFDTHKFAVITYEHDHYLDVSRSCRRKSRNYLKLLGYELVVGDVSSDGVSVFEDWWAHPDLVDPVVLEAMKQPTAPANLAEYFYSA